MPELIKKLLNTYTLFARYLPVILSALPVFVFWFYLSDNIQLEELVAFILSLKFVGGMTFSFALLYVCSLAIREISKRFQRKYFTGDGAKGFPTTYLMTYTDSTLSDRYKDKYRELISYRFNFELLNKEEEEADLIEARKCLVVSQVSIDSYYEKWYAACHCHKSFQLESMMPAKRYPVLLDSEQRASLITLTTSGTASARKLTHARILLKADAGEFGPAFLDKAIKAALDVSLSTIQRVRKTFVLEGLEAALLPRRPSQGARPRKFDGDKEAHLIALACSDPPEGYACWTLRLLAEKMVELHHFSSISHESIRQVLKKTSCVLGVSSAGVSQQKLPRRS